MQYALMQDLSFEVAPVIGSDISLSECMAIIRDAVASQKGSNEAIQKEIGRAHV